MIGHVDLAAVGAGIVGAVVGAVLRRVHEGVGARGIAAVGVAGGEALAVKRAGGLAVTGREEGRGEEEEAREQGPAPGEGPDRLGMEGREAVEEGEDEGGLSPGRGP